MKNKTIIIDGNNLLHRAYNKYKSMRSDDGKLTGSIFGFPYILRSLIRLHSPTKVIVVFDGGRDKRRLKLLPDYKKRKIREDFDYENFISQKEEVMKILSFLCIEVLHNKNFEADDLIWLVARKYSRKGKVMIVSSDKDFIQLIDKQISIWNPWKDDRITHLNYKKHYKFSPEQCVDYLSLDGDTSDNIPGYKGVGEKTALAFLDEYGSIDNYLSDLSLPEHKKIKRKELKALYKVNKEIIDVKLFCKKHKIKLKDCKTKTSKKIDIKELRLLCSKYSITSIIKDDFIQTFKQIA
jgi:DNA polymerase-1